MSENALTNKAGQALAAPTGAWGTENVSTKDVLIPRLLLCQDLSDAVKKGKAKTGDIINSVTGQVVAKQGEKLAFVPIFHYREWIVNSVDNRNKEKFLRRETITSENETAAEEEMTEKDGLIRRTYQLCFFVVLPKFIEDLPFLISFKKSSRKAGKALSTHLRTAAMKGQPAAAMTWNLFSEIESYEDYTYPVFQVEPGEATPPALLGRAYEWYKQVSAGSQQADEAAAE